MARHDAQGAPLWAYAMGGPSTDITHAVAVDPRGYVAVAGLATGAAQLGPEPLPDHSKNDAFWALLSPAGVPLRAARFGADSYDMGTAVAASASNGVVGGYFVGAVDFGFGPLQSEGTGQAAFGVQLAGAP